MLTLGARLRQVLGEATTRTAERGSSRSELGSARTEAAVPPGEARGGSKRWIAATSLGLAMMFAAGCRVTEDDVHRWETREHGPDKLRAVLFFPKYDTALRVQAGLSLIKMKPRGGRAVGLDLLVKTLGEIPPEERAPIMAQLVPAIVAELKKPPPPVQADQKAPPDPSFAYKDAAFAVLTFDKTVLVTDEALKGSLKQALQEWAMADFERRIDNRTQTYGMEQLLRYLGPDSVAGLPKLMTRDSTHLDKMSSLIQELGSEATKEAASKSLVDIATYTLSDEWTKVKTPQLQAANKASKLDPTPQQFAYQLNKYQDEELVRVFGSMKKVGGRAAIDFALGFAADSKQSEERRQAALASLEGRIEKKNGKDIDRVLDIAKSDAPGIVLDQAFRRIGELPRDAVIDKLYAIFATDKWKTRRAAAGVVLKMSSFKNIDEFMSKLPDKDGSKGFAMPEAITYGANFADLKDGAPRDALKKFLGPGTANNPAVRTSALSFYMAAGTKDDLATLQPFEKDGSKVPVCDADEDCKWICVVPSEKDPKQTEKKDIKTVGDYVTFCIEPAIADRAAKAAKEKAGDKK
jgi:hypothetical protein